MHSVSQVLFVTVAMILVGCTTPEPEIVAQPLIVTPGLDEVQGEYTASVTVLRLDGFPASGEPFILELDMTGPDPKISSGTIPESGILKMTGFAGGPDGPTYQLIVGKHGVEADRFQLAQETKQQSLQITVSPEPGSRYADIPMQDLFSSDMENLATFEGKIIYLEFWASWCGPCQAPMEEAEKTLRKNADEWKDKVAFVEVSMDDTPDVPRAHVTKYDWKSMDHFWSSEGEAGFFSDAPRVYGIDSIPTALLIDTKGTVVWRGDPNDINIESKVAELFENSN